MRLRGPDEVMLSEQMAPYVWRLADGRFSALIRIVPPPFDGGDCTGQCWYGESDDGLIFTMDEAPILAPSPGGPDAKGCEDPTVVLTTDRVIVYYSGVDADGNVTLLWASGPDIHALKKRGVALRTKVGEESPKEAEVGFLDGRWLICYEFSEDGSSVLGVAEGDGPNGPWRRLPVRLRSRDGGWDSHHLSAGPVIKGKNAWIIFYNGATAEAVWGIGWMMFDQESFEIIARSDQPLIAPPGMEDGRNIAFAASCVVVGGDLHLYFSYNDRSLHRAVVTWNDAPEATNRVSIGA